MSDSGTDYFAFFSPLPTLDPLYGAAQTLKDARLQSNAPQRPPGDAPGHLEARAPSAPPPRQRSCIPDDASGIGKKRFWPGSPNPEEIQRGLRRPRPANTTPSFVASRRLASGTLDGRNPWESARRLRYGEGGDTRNSLGLAFAPAAASTPSIRPSVHAQDDTLQRRSVLGSPISLRPQRSAPATNPSTRPRIFGRSRPDESLEEAQPMDEDEQLSGEDGGGNENGEDTQSSRPARDKGKGKARAPSSQLESEAEEEREAADEGDVWDELQLAEARELSRQQALVDRAARHGGTHVMSYTQTTGAGPSGFQPGAGVRGRDAFDDADDAQFHRPRAYDATRLSDQYRFDGNSAANGMQRERSMRRTFETNGTTSTYAPLPNTRAAQYVAEHGLGSRRPTLPPLPQRSPPSRIAGLQASRHSSRASAPHRRDDPFHRMNFDASPRSENWVDAHDQGARQRHDKRDQTMDEERDSNAAGWGSEEEEGELLPSALRNEDGALRFEPTAAPEGGFPTIHRDDPEARLRGMATDWIREMWSDPARSVVFIDVFNYRYTEDDAHNHAIEERIRRAMEFISGERGFNVVPPEPEEGLRARARDLPTLWAIRGLTPEGVTRALERRVWSFPFLSFHTAPRSTTTSSAATHWLMQLEGFLTPNEHNIRTALLRVLEGDEMSNWIARMVYTNPEFAGFSIEHAVNMVMRTLRVETLQLGNGNYVTNVYMRSPTRDINEWRRWVADLRSRRYRSFANGTGR
ncbi:hypothetical protein K466DRAFT_571057, partial [Polyporus arcularius HHB13444]